LALPDGQQALIFSYLIAQLLRESKQSGPAGRFFLAYPQSGAAVLFMLARQSRGELLFGDGP